MTMPKNEIKTNRRRVTIKFTEPTLTKQEFKEQCDIRTIIKKFMTTGELPSSNRPPLYADVSQIPDYHTALSKIRAADSFFNSLPAELRAKFNNDPGELLKWASDPMNQKAQRDMGLTPPSSENLTNAQKNDKISAVSGSSTEAERPESSK